MSPSTYPTEERSHADVRRGDRIVVYYGIITVREAVVTPEWVYYVPFEDQPCVGIHVKAPVTVVLSTSL